MEVQSAKFDLLKKILVEDAVCSDNSKSEITELINDFTEDFNNLDGLISSVNKSYDQHEEKVKNLIRLRSNFMCIEDYISEINEILSKKIEKS